MKIASIQYSLETLSLEVYIAGCKPPHCKDCHNPELHDFDNGASMEDWEETIRGYASSYCGEIPMIESIWVLGGEPLDQDIHNLCELLIFLKSLFDTSELLLFTRYEIDEVPADVMALCHGIKTGRYVKKLPPRWVEFNGTGLRLASSNQELYLVYNKGQHEEAKRNISNK